MQRIGFPFGLVAMAFALLVLAGCSNQARRPGKLRVVVTYSVLGDLVKNVAADCAEIVVLVGPDGDAHTFEPTPKDGIGLADADLVFENGIGFEPWLDKLHAASNSKARRVVVTQGLEILEGECNHNDKVGEKHEHEDDPHVWHEVENSIHMVGIIRDKLAEVDPVNSEKYKTNSTKYLKRLEALDLWVLAQVEILPKDRRKLVTSHDTFGYFANRYGFQVLGTLLSSFSTEASDPSPVTFAKLVDSIKAAKVPAIFAENTQNPKVMERLAREAGVKLAPPLFTDALGKPGTPGDTYENMIRSNVTTIVDALKQ
jgi:ABC-type Zn uptake system ZnuABC Zn-binding protein ZnuA